MRIIPLRSVVLVSLLICACDRTAVTDKQAQNSDAPQAERADTSPTLLRAVGQQTLDALKHGDAVFLASVVDEKIALGTDNPITSSPDFKRELKSRSGAYCDLFGCDSAQNSVRNLVSGKTLAVRALNSKGPPERGQVDVFETKPGQSSPDTSRSPVITMLFVNRRGTWRLTAIEYI
jgi:hypothetical protein